MKKFISTVMALVMLLALASPTAMAAGMPTVSISSGEVQPGGEVTLTVSIKDNPGLAACMLYIYYDTSVFEVDPNSDLFAEGKFQQSGTVMGNDLTSNGEGVLALWYNSSGSNTSDDGELLKVVLRANDNAANGDYAVQLGYSQKNTRNEDGDKIIMNTGSGTVSVSGSNSTKPSTPTTPNRPNTPNAGEKPGGVEQVIFTDIEGNWAEEYILRANAAGLVEGYNGKYEPNATMTRAQFVTILWRAMGAPEPAKKATFTDLDPRQEWYWDAVAWAQENDIMNGVGNNKFGTNGSVTREQIATVLHRLAGEPKGMELMLGGIYDSMFRDSGKVSGWAKDGLYWTLSEGIYCGEKSIDLNEGSSLAPGNAADRAQIAVMMIRYLDYQGGSN